MEQTISFARASTPDSTDDPTLPHSGLSRPSFLLARPQPPCSTQPSIILVDGQEINRYVIKSILKDEPYRLVEVPTPLEALRMIERESVDLVIADLIMPEMSGIDLCRRMKADRSHRFIPLLIITSLQGVENEVACLEAGADEFMVRPLQPIAFRSRLRAMLRNKKTMDSLEEAESILFALARAVERRDRETSNHCDRLATLSVSLGLALGLGEEDIIALERGSYLHDIGKVSVPDAILHKAGPLSDEEWVVMRNHTVQGEAICSPMRTLAPVLPIIRHHHERWDGSGYPDGLSGERIPLLARILQIADIFDALTSRRPYKPAYDINAALNILQEEADKGWRDPELVAAFTHLVRHSSGLALRTPFASPTGGVLSTATFDEALQDLRSRDLDKLGSSLLQLNR